MEEGSCNLHGFTMAYAIVTRALRICSAVDGGWSNTLVISSTHMDHSLTLLARKVGQCHRVALEGKETLAWHVFGNQEQSASQAHVATGTKVLATCRLAE